MFPKARDEGLAERLDGAITLKLVGMERLLTA